MDKFRGDHTQLLASVCIESSLNATTTTTNRDSIVSTRGGDHFQHDKPSKTLPAYKTADQKRKFFQVQRKVPY